MAHYDDIKDNVYTLQKNEQSKSLKKLLNKVHNDDLDLIESVLANFESFKGFIITLQTMLKIRT